MSQFEHITTALTGRSPWPFAIPQRRDETDNKPESKTERMRTYLRTHGAANAATLAHEADVPRTALVSALLKADIARGRIVRRGDKYHWNHQFDAEHHRRLDEAATLLRANGFTVIKPQPRAETMTQPSTCNPASAQPMRGLSKRAQQLLQPRRYGQQPGPVAPAGKPPIPNALRSTRGPAK